MDMRFWLEQKFLDMGELFVGHRILVGQIFGHGKIFVRHAGMGFFFFFFFWSECFGMSN